MLWKILKELNSQNIRITPSRRAIIDIFLNSQHPLSPMEIQTVLKTNDVTVNKTTVYREINFLLQQGIINQVYLPNTDTHYEFADRNHHHHITCESCGRIEDIGIENEDNILQTAQNKSTMKIVDHSLEFIGICTSCQT